MNTKQLKSFLALANYKSYKRVSDILHYSRAAIMGQIMSLEEELGVKLFIRCGRYMELTDAGRKFSAQAQAVMDIYEQVLVDASKSEAKPHIRVLAVETFGLYFLQPALSLLLTKYPEIELSIQFGPHSSFCEKLRKKEADIAFGFAGSSWGNISNLEFKQILLCKEPVVFFTNPRSPLAKKGKIKADDLINKNIILANKDGIYSKLLGKICKQSGVSIGVQKYIDSGSLLKQFVSKNDCVSLICRRAIETELMGGILVELPWDGKDMLGEAIAVVLNDMAENEIVEKLVCKVAHYLSAQT